MTASFDADVDVTVELGFASGPFGTSITWVDVSSLVKGAAWTRGRSSVQSEFPAGKGTVLLDNSDGRFYPWNTSSPYSPNVTVGVPIRIKATHATVDYWQFHGSIPDWSSAFPTGKEELIDVPIVEEFEHLNRKKIMAEFAAARTDVRVGDVLDAAGWPAGRRDLDAGVATVAAVSADATALALMRDTALVEQGAVFQTAAGLCRFTNRIYASGGVSPAATFGPDGTELTYTDVGVAYNSDLLRNEAIVTGAAGAAATTNDSTSINTHGPATYEAASDAIPTENDALNIAEWIVAKNKDVLPRITGLSVDPAGDPTNLWPVVLGLDLLDVINVQASFPGSAVQLSQDVSIEQISHRFAAGGAWTVEYQCHPLSDIEQATFWEVGVSRLDVSTRLA